MNSNFGSINYFNCKNPPSNYKCKYCDFTTDLWINLNYHIWIRHKSFHDYSKIDSMIETYTCKNCEFTSYSILVWHRHERTCTYVSTSPHMTSYCLDRETYFCCKLCEYKSIDGHDFQLHILQHNTDQKSFKRDQCKYKTRMQCDLKPHFRIRRSSRNQMHYYCSECSYKNLSLTHLKNHVIVRHTDPKEIKWFECNQCEYKAKTKNHLNYHLGQKHKACFKCSHCTYKTGFKASLKRHVIARHTDPDEIEWFECNRCGYKSKEKGALKKHVNAKHFRILRM